MDEENETMSHTEAIVETARILGGIEQAMVEIKEQFKRLNGSVSTTITRLNDLEVTVAEHPGQCKIQDAISRIDTAITELKTSGAERDRAQRRRDPWLLVILGPIITIFVGLILSARIDTRQQSNPAPAPASQQQGVHP